MKKSTSTLRVLLFVLLFSNTVYSQQLITTVAGNGTPGYSGDGGPATTAQINKPEGILVDIAGNLYIPDQYNNRIRKVDAATGIITTIAGTGVAGYSGDGGLATLAQLNNPKQIAIDASGNLLIADYTNKVIRKITPAGIISTFAGNGTAGYSGDGGPATMAQLSGPFGIAVDGGTVYISDANRIRKIDATGIITTFAGTGSAGFGGDGGPATAAQLNNPLQITIDAAGNVFFADANNHRIRKINTAGIISTIAGIGSAGYSGDGGPAMSAEFNTPCGLARDAAGNFYVAEFWSNRIRKINTGGIITTIAGTGVGGYSGDGGLATGAQLYHPEGVAMHGNSIYVADVPFNHRIRKIFPDHLPYFVPGDTAHRAVCTEIITIDTLLAVTDSDAAQTMTWSVVTPPTHGVLSASYTTTSTGGTLLPSPTSYSPMAGYVGPDTFKVSVSDGFAADTITVYLQVGCPDAVQSINTNPNGVNVYPNPSTSRFTISFNSATHNEAAVTITDAVGRVVRRLTLPTNSATTIDVNTPGVYFVKCVLPDGQVITNKLIVTGNE